MSGSTTARRRGWGRLRGLPALVVVLLAALTYVPGAWATAEAEDVTVAAAPETAVDESEPPAPVDPAPAPDDVAPAPVEPAPAPVDPAPAPDEPPPAPVAPAEPVIEPPGGIPAPPPGDVAPPPPTSEPAPSPAEPPPATLPPEPLPVDPAPPPAPVAAPMPEPSPAPAPSPPRVADGKRFAEFAPPPVSESLVQAAPPANPTAGHVRRGLVETLHLRTVLGAQLVARHASEPSDAARPVILALGQRRGASAGANGGSASPSFSPDNSGGSFALISLLALGFAAGGLVVRTAIRAPGSVGLRLRLERPG